MKYIILENISTDPSIYSDDNCQSIVYSTLLDASKELPKHKDSMIVPLSQNLMPTILNCSNFIDSTKFELGESWDEMDLEGDVNNLITT